MSIKSNTLVDLLKTPSMKAQVLRVHGDDQLAQRLFSIGFQPHVVVSIEYSLWGGETLVVRLPEGLIGLRKAEAQRVEISNVISPEAV